MNDKEIELMTNAGQMLGLKTLNDYEKAYALWAEWFQIDGSPIYASEIDGDSICFFCNAWADIEPHAEGCIYMKAKRLLNWAEASDE